MRELKQSDGAEVVVQERAVAIGHVRESRSKGSTTERGLFITAVVAIRASVEVKAVECFLMVKGDW